MRHGPARARVHIGEGAALAFALTGIAAHLRLARSTVEAVLRRYQMPLLRHLDQNSGLPVRRSKPRRYEHPTPGDMVHLDIKKLGRIPDGGGHRKLGRQAGRRNRSGMGYSFLHHAVDDHSRLAYSEILGDERKETAAAFWECANAFFVEHGITGCSMSQTGDV